MDKEAVRELGIWTMRLALVGGAIYAGINGNNDVAGGCISALVISFFFL
jgi:hypothetical protein